ncbi:MAG: dTDP-4-dehydrorhamnose 3,5-epimerase [Pseudomonadota bacterium]|nr:dTDP-4-dehydrorhamnose 3,5-epimerase [Pseudomonadota bacterium]
MEIERFAIAGPLHFTMPRFGDARGYFTETFNAEKLANEGIAELQWVQDNQSYSTENYTLRGLHFQLPPFAQAKIVRVLSGRIFDVAVDIRPLSETFGKWLSLELIAEKQNQFYIPAGFAHGFLTLTPDVVIAYKVSAPYSRTHDRCLNWADPALAIRWPLPNGMSPKVSEKDENASMLSSLASELKDHQ